MYLNYRFIIIPYIIYLYHILFFSILIKKVIHIKFIIYGGIKIIISLKLK